MTKERSLQKGDDMKKKIRPGVQDVRLKSKNRPELVDQRPRWALFSTQGSTGWRRRRDISTHKGNRKEGDFRHLHDKFTEEEA
jgi:hypothetical protein